jgi:hypothetical protein
MEAGILVNPTGLKFLTEKLRATPPCACSAHARYGAKSITKNKAQYRLVFFDDFPFINKATTSPVQNSFQNHPTN